MEAEGIDTSNSWYELDEELSTRQKNYVQLLENIWQVKSPRGKSIPYNMTDYQKEYHAHSLNILGEDSNHILWNKARGISFTISTLIELIMTAASFDQQEIPVITHRQKASYKLLDEAKWLIRNCKLEELKDNADYTEKSSYISFADTGSTIRVYPSSAAADAVRSTRLIRGMIDEFAFQRNGQALWTAAKETMRSNFGQWIIGSTPSGRQNKFFDLVDRARKQDIGFDLFELPVFDPEKFDVDKPITEQDIQPIAPWISSKRLENRRKEDQDAFLQENQCDFLDKTTALIPYRNILKVTRKSLHNYHEEFEYEPGFIYKTQNPMLFGVDVAEKNDFFACSGFEIVTTSEGQEYAVQRYLNYFRNIQHTEMEEYLENILNAFPSIIDMKIDSTGMGGFLPNYLQQSYKDKVTGVNFSKKIKTSQRKLKVKTRDAMSYNFRKEIENKTVFLIEDQEQINHINSITRDLDVADDIGEGHGDIFFANALALLQNTRTLRRSAKQSSESLSPRKKSTRKPESDIMERIKNYRKTESNGIL